MTQLLLPPPIATDGHAEVKLGSPLTTEFTKSFQQQTPNRISWNEWVGLYEPYVHCETRNGNARYSVDHAALPAHLEGGDWADLADYSCDVRNTMRGPEGSEQEFVVANAAGQPVMRYVAYWWGWRTYLNHYACIWGGAGTGSVALGAAFAASLLGTGVPGIIVGAIGTYLAVYAVVLQALDEACNEAGAYCVGTWASPGTPWAEKAC